MSNIHACDYGAPESARTPFYAVETLHLSATALARGLVIALQHRRTMRRFARFSDHRLRDIGFKRDWDGSIIPLHR